MGITCSGLAWPPGYLDLLPLGLGSPPLLVRAAKCLGCGAHLAELLSCLLLPTSYRVKSEAVIARREPREEVEDVSSYLCTELVYPLLTCGHGWAGNDSAS